jgi:small GTP-binding protein
MTSNIDKHSNMTNTEDTNTKNISDAESDALIETITTKINQIRNYTPKIAVFGNSGVGKSSLCNALFGKEIAKISDVEACTRKPQEIFIGGKQGNGGINLIDVPGIAENKERHQEYTALYLSLAKEVDLILWAIKSDDRSYASAEEVYEKIIESAPSVPIVFVVTQVDKMNPIREWNENKKEPGDNQKNNISLKELDISRQFKVSADKIISISAEESYNLTRLVDLVVEVLPNEKKYSFTREAKEEIVSEKTRVMAEKGIWDSIKELAGSAWEKVKDPVTTILVETGTKIVSNLIKKFKFW